jgi:hypothetical protein
MNLGNCPSFVGNRELQLIEEQLFASLSFAEFVKEILEGLSCFRSSSARGGRYGSTLLGHGSTRSLIELSAKDESWCLSVAFFGFNEG